jgi:hypothetical protein
MRGPAAKVGAIFSKGDGSSVRAVPISLNDVLRTAKLYYGVLARAASAVMIPAPVASASQL